MTAEQMYLLDYLEEQEEAAIHGVAGTGKTVLAVQKPNRFLKLALSFSFALIVS